VECLKLKYILSSFEIDEIIESRTNEFELKKGEKRKVEKFWRKVLREYTDFDIEFQDEGIYVKDLDVLNKYSSLLDYNIYNGVLIIKFLEYMNIYIPERVLKDEEFKDKLLLDLENYKVENMKIQEEMKMNDDIKYDENDIYEQRCIKSEEYFIQENGIGLSYRSGYIGFYTLGTMLIVMSLVSIQFSLNKMIYGSSITVDYIFKYIFIGLFAFGVWVLTFKSKKSFNIRKLDPRFNYYLSVDEKFLKIRIDSKKLKKEVKYNLETIVKFVQDGYIYKVYYKHKRGYKLISVANSKFNLLGRREFEDRLTKIVQRNNCEAEFDSKAKKRTKTRKILRIISFVLFIGVFVIYFITPIVIKKSMPKLNTKIMKEKEEYNQYVIAQKKANIT
jgi:hypothetical protein